MTTASEASRIAQIYHISSTDTEQIAWCLDAESQTVCVRTPLIFSILVEALSVDNPARGIITDRSRNIPLTEDIFKKFLTERKQTLRGLSISSIERTSLQDIYFYQGGLKKPYLRVFFSSLSGFSRFRDGFQGKAAETKEEEILEIEMDQDEQQSAHLIAEDDQTAPSKLMKQHPNVMLVTEGIFAKFRILESDIAPYWHWLIHHGIRAASTIVIPSEARLIESDDPSRLSKAVREFSTSSIKLSPYGDISTNPKILSWDIESLSENPARFPNACALGDVAFFISAYIKRYNDPDNSPSTRRVGIYLVDSIETLGLSEARLADGTELIIVETEEALLRAFWNLIREENPQVLLGYNTMGFDSRYLHHRMSIYQCDYPNLSLMRDEKQSSTSIRQFMWSSSAYKAVECWYYDTPGMLILDLFVELKRNETLKAYTLDAVSEHFLGEHKVDLKAREMFKIYLQYQQGERTEMTRAEMRRIAEYGMQDSVLPARIFDLRMQWITYAQMACIMGVGIMDLITRGQTLRTKANIYRTCRELGFVINVPRDKPTFTGKFKGAYVCEMAAGLYNHVIVYDFSSLYPSIISAFNLSYETFIHQRDWHLYPDASMYTSFIVTTASGLSREVRYIKASIFRGILPRVVDGFLAARAETRALLKKERDPIKKAIFDKKQSAIKVSNNSVYGAVGADFSTKGLASQMSDVCPSSLGLKWIAMTVTEIGQTLIKGCTSFLQKKYKATAIYGDTDSTFVTVPPDDSGVPLWERAELMAKDFNATLPPPLKIELEKIIRMVGLTAKRYLYRKYIPTGELEREINYKGVVATRRDTCKWQVQLFSDVAEGILQDIGKEAVTKIIYRAIINLMEGQVPIKHLLIGCSVAESYKSATCRMAILKERMASLGRPIAGGSRVEFVVVQIPETISSSGPMDDFLVKPPPSSVVGEGQPKLRFKSPYVRGPRGGTREDNVSARVRMLDELVEGEFQIDYAYYVAHMAQKSIDQLFGAAYQDDSVIEPLVEGLRFNASETIAEMKIVMNR